MVKLMSPPSKLESEIDSSITDREISSIYEAKREDENMKIEKKKSIAKQAGGKGNKPLPKKVYPKRKNAVKFASTM